MHISPAFENEIMWTGLISQKEIADILRSSHVFISASRIETFGKAIIESQACGLPVIATRTDGANFIIQSAAQGILVDINDVHGLSGAIADMYDNYNLYDAEKICNSVTKFSSTDVIRTWIEKYAEVVS